MSMDRKYGKVMTEHGNIPDDEPVFVLRAQDRLAVVALEAYVATCRACLEVKTNHSNLVDDAISAFKQWDVKKTPDS